MIKINRETEIVFDGEDAWQLTQLAKYVIEVIQTGDVNGYGWGKETLEELKTFASRFSDAIPNEGFL